MTRSSDGSARAGSGSSIDDRIVQAALALIAQDGLGAVTMMRIANTAGVSRQTLYNHYPDVDSIVAEAIGRHNRESIDLLESSMRVVDDPEGKLEQLVRHAVSIGVHARHAPGIEHGLSADTRATLGEYDAALDRCIRDVLEQGRRSGAFRGDLMLGVDVGLVRHMLNGLAEQSARTPDRAAAIAGTGVRTVLAAVAER
jgi:AcrR family transcriptional regulator